MKALLAVICIVSIPVFLGWAVVSESRNNLSTAYKRGQSAYTAGVEASANPYQGMNSTKNQATAWLDGWVEGAN